MRIQLSAAEKKVMAERIKTDRLDANLLFLVQEWNEEYLERSISWSSEKNQRRHSSDIHTGGILGLCQ